MMMSGRNNDDDGGSISFRRHPFTQSQWQELEQQALIYKYMASGIPIPHDLLIPIRRSFLLLNPPTQLPPPSMGWSSCFQLGYGRKMTEDPEPGRCRRTDGKKWRCSKEAYTDSKYCERHMHRGKNRSRKPVETTVVPNCPPAAFMYPQHHPYPWELSLRRREGELAEMREMGEKQQECFVLGADFRQQPSAMKERDFFDGWAQNLLSPPPPPSSSSSACSKTQLSISMGLHDFPH